MGVSSMAAEMAWDKTSFLLDIDFVNFDDHVRLMVNLQNMKNHVDAPTKKACKTETRIILLNSDFTENGHTRGMTFILAIIISRDPP